MLSHGAGEGNRTLVCSLGSGVQSRNPNSFAGKPADSGVNPIKGLGTAWKTGFAVLAPLLLAAPAHAQITAFQHVVIIVQENRTPDNLFYEMCETHACSTSNPLAYDIQTSNWQTADGPVQPHATPLGTSYDLCHAHACWVNDYASGAMNGFDANACFVGICPAHPSYGYVSDAAAFGASIKPYLDLATQYGWANDMFQTNQGPSFPAHQYVFGATSALTAQDDSAGNFMAENPTATGCTAPPAGSVEIIDANGNENMTAYPCADHAALPDLLEQGGATWRYYGVEGNYGAQSLWLAPGSLANYCGGYQVANCTGPQWANVDTNPPDALTDIADCKLANVTWITPEGPYSDHADMGNQGPSWVASLVNAIGMSECGYWQNTAILIVWDDWGGWYDHEPPAILPYPQGGYQLGFRVPLLFVSAYTPAGTIDNTRLDFGSIVRFVEGNYGIPEGALGFADSRATSDLSGFYNLGLKPRAFRPVAATHDGKWFVSHGCRKGCAPDDD